MNNPQTPMEAAIQAYASDDLDMNEPHINRMQETILAFLQWFENEPEQLARAMMLAEKLNIADEDEGAWLEKAWPLKLPAANAAIQFLKSMAR